MSIFSTTVQIKMYWRSSALTVSVRKQWRAFVFRWRDSPEDQFSLSSVKYSVLILVAKCLSSPTSVRRRFKKILLKPVYKLLLNEAELW